MKILKKITLVILLFLVLYMLLIVIEVKRFNNTLGSKPLIVLTKEQNDEYKIYYGLGYKIKYRYYQGSIVSGEIRIFNYFSYNWIT